MTEHTGEIERCAHPIWDGRYWCVLPTGHGGPHESAPFGEQKPWAEPDQPGRNETP